MSPACSKLAPGSTHEQQRAVCPLKSVLKRNFAVLGFSEPPLCWLLFWALHLPAGHELTPLAQLGSPLTLLRMMFLVHKISPKDFKREPTIWKYSSQTVSTFVIWKIHIALLMREMTKPSSRSEMAVVLKKR